MGHKDHINRQRYQFMHRVKYKMHMVKCNIQSIIHHSISTSNNEGKRCNIKIPTNQLIYISRLY